MEEKEPINELSNIQPDNPLTRAIVASKDGSITVTKCQICLSKNRNDIEIMLEKGSTIPAIMKFLEEKGEAYARWKVDYHFENHYKNMAQQAALVEYRDRLDEMMKRRRNMVDDVEHSTGIAWEEISSIVVMPAKTLDDKEKKSRIITQYLKTIRENHMFIKSLHDEETVRRASEERFGKVWILALEHAKTEEEKKLIISTLQEFKEQLLQIGT